jgi:anaerobic selenocysteine-containing dehydrogenase
MPESLPSVCPHDCPSVCGLLVERLGPGRIGRVRGAPDHPYTQGAICVKVARYAERVHHPERLSHPLIRVGAKGEGKFAPISWEEALDRVADSFKKAARLHGPETVWPYQYAGTMGLVQRGSLERLRHVMGYSRQDFTICGRLADSAMRAGQGAKWGAASQEMLESDLIIVWGGNPVSTQVTAMHWIAKARKERGAKLVVIDPYRTPSAQQADLHLALRPGTDGALACAMMQVILAEGLADREYLAQYSDFSPLIEAHLASKTPEWAAKITGLSPESIRDFARLYGNCKRSFIRFGYGMTRGRTGAVNLHAATCLPVITGSWRHRGGGALHAQWSCFTLNNRLLEGADRLDPRTRILDQCRIGPVLTGDKKDLGQGPPVTAMIIQNTNPANVAPETLRVRNGLARPDLFLCVHEQFLTDTARYADIVLPATMFLEHEDIYVAGAHSILQVAKAVIEPFAEARSNHQVVSELAKRLGAAHPGFELSAWEVIDETLRLSNYPAAETIWKNGGHDCGKSFEEAHYLKGFGHPDGKFRFAPDWAAIGPYADKLPPLPDHCEWLDEASPEHPFRLVAAPARNFLNTSFTETPTSRGQEKQPRLLLHPDDCQRLGVIEGEWVKLANRLGEVTIAVEPFVGLQPGVVVVESIWPNGDFACGIGINALISALPGYPNGGGVFHDTAVRIEKLRD